MKKFLIFLIFICGIVLIALVMKTDVIGIPGNAGKITTVRITETADVLGQEIRELSKGADTAKASEVLDFVKEKKNEGALNSVSDIREAIREGGEQFGVDISEDHAAKVAETLDQLSDMGLSTDTLVDEADKLYRKYGEEFTDHMEEAFVNAAKEAAGSAAQNTWDGLKEKVSSLIHGGE